MLDKIRVLDTNLLVKISPESEEEKSPSGIILSPSAKGNSVTAKVVKVGDGHLSNDGFYMKLGVNVGDSVVFNKYDGKEVTIDNINYMLIDYSVILYVIEN